MTPWDIAGFSEHSIQAAFVAWVRKARFVGFALAWEPSSYAKHPASGLQPVEELDLLHAIPNGGDRNLAVANRLKAEGVRPGVPDIFLPWPGQFGAGLYLEFKNHSGTLSKDQKKFIELVQRSGMYRVEVVRDWEHAARLVERHMTGG